MSKSEIGLTKYPKEMVLPGLPVAEALLDLMDLPGT